MTVFKEVIKGETKMAIGINDDGELFYSFDCVDYNHYTGRKYNLHDGFNLRDNKTNRDKLDAFFERELKSHHMV